MLSLLLRVGIYLVFKNDYLYKIIQFGFAV